MLFRLSSLFMFLKHEVMCCLPPRNQHHQTTTENKIGKATAACFQGSKATGAL